MKLPEYSTPPHSRSLISWLWFFVRPHRTRFAAATTIRFIMESIWILPPLFWGIIITLLEEHGDTRTAALYLGLLAGSITIASLLGLTRIYLEAALRDRVKREMSAYALNHTLSLPLTWHETSGTGNTMQRIFTAREALNSLLRIFWQGLIALLATLTSLAISLTFLGQARYLGMFCLFMVIYCGIVLIFTRPTERVTDQLNAALEGTLGKAYEFSSAVQAVKTFRLTPTILRKVLIAEDAQILRIRTLFTFIYSKWTLLNISGGVGIFGIIGGYALYEVTQGTLSIGLFITILGFGWHLWGTLEELADIMEDFTENKMGFLRLMDTLRIPREAVDLPPAAPFPKDWDGIHFTHVSHTYTGKANALTDLSFTIRRGERIAIVGRSGGGKSTLVKLLMKHMLPTKGGIQFGTVDSRHIPAAALASRIAVVPQEVELFNLSVRENVLIRGTSPEKLSEYLRMAHATDFVATLPKKEATLLGERGVKLSGGQRQRIGIARALACEPDILIFDEATSSLDTESEQAIQAALHEIFTGKTALIIAHRLSTIRIADRIMVLENGRIVELGTFAELLKKPRGRFTALWNAQKLD